MDIEKRQPVAGSRFKDRSGTVTKHGVKVLSFSGFSGPFSVWHCLCPLCGDEFDVYQTALGTQRSCGYECRGRSLRHTSPKLHGIWTRLRSTGGICPEWFDDWRAMLDAVGPLSDTQTLVLIDPAKPLGPGNFAVRPLRDHGKPVADWHGEPVTVKRAAEILGITRQRAAQLMNADELQTRLNRIKKVD